MDLGNQLKATIRTVPDFPIDGIQFRDITPVLSDPALMERVMDSFEGHARTHAPTCVAGPEARGFIFGPLLAMRLN
ncbi:MAG: adenine phosphoribosyltransferase, partial [Candidatus Thermoplasmatota archaeon]|nr:adenine phosphoribosyltransferase [Candidatus Thermoplasmatota archaeon]